jgi:hypothetical protein
MSMLTVLGGRRNPPKLLSGTQTRPFELHMVDLPDTKPERYEELSQPISAMDVVVVHEVETFLSFAREENTLQDTKVLPPAQISQQQQEPSDDQTQKEKRQYLNTQMLENSLIPALPYAQHS